ncbi:MAG: DUF1846 domain-containing protein [Christensenellales bacterium]|jgi:uncharacterized protein (UPF0371 family)
MRIGFDNQLYLDKQAQMIREKIAQFDNKLYLEFGGKLFDDYHASRVLPGFDVNAKIRLLQQFKDQAEIIFCINAGDIENAKIRADFGITYDRDLLRTIDAMRKLGLLVTSVVITQYSGQPAAETFARMLTQRGVSTYMHEPIPGYPADVDRVVSDQGYGANPYIPTTRQLVVVTAPGPCSGKMATCLSQLYHEHRRHVKAGYAKFETFPIWNLPLKHPVNLAYEAATADLKDVNMIDPFHLEAYGKTTVNYNRDIEVFPVVRTILERIMGDASVYQSPTDMGVNMAGFAIFDDEAVRQAACQEIIRRSYKAWCDYKQGRTDIDTAQRIDVIMNQLALKKEDRRVVTPALAKSQEKGVPCMAVELPDGQIVTGKTSDLMNAPASVMLNSIKALAGIADELHLISPIVLAPILKLKKHTLHNRMPVLNLEEVLIALSICAATSPLAELAMDKLTMLRGCEAHSSHMLTHSDEQMLQRLGLNLTSQAQYPTDDLYFA